MRCPSTEISKSDLELSSWYTIVNHMVVLLLSITWLSYYCQLQRALRPTDRTTQTRCQLIRSGYYHLLGTIAYRSYKVTSPTCYVQRGIRGFTFYLSIECYLPLHSELEVSLNILRYILSISVLTWSWNYSIYTS